MVWPNISMGRNSPSLRPQSAKCAASASVPLHMKLRKNSLRILSPGAYSGSCGNRRLYRGRSNCPPSAAAAALDALAHGNVILAPAVERYSYQPGTSVRIMECFGTLAPLVCESAVFDRLIIVGGETSQAIFRHLHVNHLELGRALEPGVASRQDSGRRSHWQRICPEGRQHGQCSGS